ncbi:MAG: hypothetical protein CMO31_00240 [Trueperaceae bacterium]|nr:hypothetical protein [Trueperaceae bacterium]
MLRAYFTYLGLMVALIGCFPRGELAASNLPEIAIANGPRSIALDGLAEKVQDQIGLFQLKEVRFSRPASVRARERSHAFGPGRLVNDALRIGRNIGAELVVLVGVPDFERTTREYFSLGLPNPLQQVREVKISLRLQLIVIGVAKGRILREYLGPFIEMDRTESATAPILPIDQDPDYVEVLTLGIQEISSYFANWLKTSYTLTEASESNYE